MNSGKKLIDNDRGEDETFRNLKKLPLLEVYQKWKESPIAGQTIKYLPEDKDESDVRLEISEFFNQFGWGYKEFIREWAEYYRRKENV